MLCAALDKFAPANTAPRRQDRLRHRPAGATTSATPSTPPSWRASSAGRRRVRWRWAWRRPCAGTWTTASGSTASAGAASSPSGWAWSRHDAARPAVRRDGPARPRDARRQDADIEVVALSRAEVDLTDPAALLRAVETAGEIDLVFNAAAYTAVDKAESEPDLAYAVNARGPEALAKACAARDVPFLHISTDMGVRRREGRRLCRDRRDQSAARLRRLQAGGEQAVLAAHDRALVARVSWLFSAYGQNFLQAMLRLGEAPAGAEGRGRPAGQAHRLRRRGRLPPEPGRPPGARAQGGPPTGACCIWSIRARPAATRWPRRSSPWPGPAGPRR